MGNSMRSTPAPPERPLPSSEGKSGFFSGDGAVGVLTAVRTGQWVHRASLYRLSCFAGVNMLVIKC